MSRPRPVDPPPLRPRAIAVSGIPGPASATTTSAPPAARGRTATRTAVPSGVWAKTLPRSASTAAPRSVGATRTGSGPSAICTRDGAALLLGQHRPEAHPFRDDGGRVAPGAQPLADRAPGLGDDLVDPLADGVDVLQQADAIVLRQRLDVQPQRGERGPQPVGEIGRGLALGGQELTDPPGQVVHGGRDTAHLGRSRGGRPGGQVAGAEPVRRRRQVGHRPGERAGQPVGHEQGQQEQDDPQPTEHQPGPGDAGAQQVGRHEDLHDRDALGPPDRLHEARPVLGLQHGGGHRRLVVPGRADVAQPRPVGPAHRHAAAAVHRAGQPGRHLLGRVEPDRGDEHLQLSAGGVQRARLGHPGDERGGRQQEREQHDRRGRRHQQRDLAPHGAGSASRTPTPRTVCSSRGSAALSPSLRRSHDRWTSTVLSAPP